MTEQHDEWCAVNGCRCGNCPCAHLPGCPEPDVDTDTGMPLWLRWWAFKAWFHRCPECGHRPDKHYDSTGPRWEDDKTAHMLGIGKYGCRRCGHGAVEERDAEAALREKIELVLRGSGLSNEPWKYDSNIHGWRCEYPGRYGKCDCFDELLNDLVRAVQGKEPSNE